MSVKSSNKILEVKNLTVAYENKDIIKNVTFDVKKGEITAILGPNGSGKSTLIKAILGLTPIKKGSVKIFGKEAKEVLCEIGYLPQRFNFDINFPITVFEFLKLSLKDEKEVHLIDDKLGEVGLRKFKNTLLGELSGGQLQRILIARAILNDPKLLVLDEPEAGIDIQAERDFYQMIKHLDEEHDITVIIISHELDLVYNFAEQVICINKELVCKGVPSKALTPQALEKMYGGGLSHNVHSHTHGS